MQSVPITTNVVSSNPAQTRWTRCDKFVSDYDRSVIFSGFSGFLHQQNKPPRYNWNIVESCMKIHKLKLKKNLNPLKKSETVLKINIWQMLALIGRDLSISPGWIKLKTCVMVHVSLLSYTKWSKNMTNWE